MARPLCSRRYLSALVDEIRLHVIPVLLGGGMPLFATLDSAIILERTQVLVTPAATHLTFRVVP